MIMWQMVLIYIIGIAAFIYMAWFLFFPRRKKNHCAGCPGQGSCRETNEKSKNTDFHCDQ